MSEESIHIAEGLAAAVLRSADGKAAEWFGDRFEAVSRGYDRNVFLAAFAGAGRRLRSFAVVADADTVGAAEALGVQSFSSWSLDRLARCSLLRAVLHNSPEQDQPEIIDEVFRTGDNEERESLLAGLLLFPGPQRFLPTALEACRTNVDTVFSAIACENAYPSIYFPEAGFNQMVMKAVFIDIPLDRVMGLADRRNDELARMASDFSEERRAAGRPVPADLALITPRSGSSEETSGNDA